MCTTMDTDDDCKAGAFYVDLLPGDFAAGKAFGRRTGSVDVGRGKKSPEGTIRVHCRGAAKLSRSVSCGCSALACRVSCVMARHNCLRPWHAALNTGNNSRCIETVGRRRSESHTTAAAQRVYRGASRPSCWTRQAVIVTVMAMPAVVW